MLDNDLFVKPSDLKENPSCRKSFELFQEVQQRFSYYSLFTSKLTDVVVYAKVHWLQIELKAETAGIRHHGHEINAILKKIAIDIAIETKGKVVHEGLNDDIDSYISASSSIKLIIPMAAVDGKLKLIETLLEKSFFSCLILSRQFDKKTISGWIIDEHCAFRFILGTDPSNACNRVAYIEKTPRVRIFKDPSMPWLYGPKGAGGPDGHLPENELYGFHPASRIWCDNTLRKLGYQL